MQYTNIFPMNVALKYKYTYTFIGSISISSAILPGLIGVDKHQIL